jgi:prepilin-type N-terminal cleavage/methylation domain-containing protein
MRPITPQKGSRAAHRFSGAWCLRGGDGARRPAPSPRAGLTLIELLVVLALIATLLAVMLPIAADALRVDQRKASVEMASTLRYVYDEAVVRNAPMRVAYDLDQRTWWVEIADGPVRIFKNREDREAFAEYMESKQESDSRVQEMVEANRGNIPTMTDVAADLLGVEGDEAGSAMGMLGGMMAGLFGGGGSLGAERGKEYKVNEFHPVEDEEEFAKRSLPPDVQFYAVWTPQYDEPVKPMDEYERAAADSGFGDKPKSRVVYTHIFPGGYMEDTVVYLSDLEGKTVTSIVVEPLTGRVRVVNDEVEPPDLRDRERSQ